MGKDEDGEFDEKMGLILVAASDPDEELPEVGDNNVDAVLIIFEAYLVDTFDDAIPKVTVDTGDGLPAVAEVAFPASVEAADNVIK